MNQMKFIPYILGTLLLCAFSTITLAQLDRSTPPEAGPAPEIQFDKPPSFTLDNGLEVIVVENHEMPVVSFQLTVDADPVMENDAVGYVSATGSLMRNGTKNKSKAEIDEAVDFIGADLVTYTNGIYASGIRKHAGTLLELMSEVLMEPVFPKEELDKYKKKQISNLTAGKTNPSQISSRVARRLRYGNHPYGELPTEATINNITREKCQDYYNTYYKPNISYLVMVGDIREDQARRMAEKYFGSWQKGDVPAHEYDFPSVNNGRRVALVNKEDAVQSVISITYPVRLYPGHPDAIQARLMNNILGGGVFSGYLMQNLREDKGYTYGARSQLNSDPLVGYFSAGAEVGTGVTDSAVHEFLYEMNRIRTEQVESEHLQLAKNAMSGSFARSLENSRTVAQFALNTKRYDLPSGYYSNYLKKVEEVTAADVQMAASKYILPDQATVLVVGNKEKVKADLESFASDSQVEIYDYNGRAVKEQKMQIPEGMTAGDVIDQYIQALGGREAVKNIREVKQTAHVEMNGQTLTIETYREKPDKLATRMLMNGRVMQEQAFDGEQASVSAMGQTQQITGKQLESFKFEAIMHKFLRYDELGVQLSLEGMEEVDGNPAYKVKITNPDGVERHEYFDAESGLKVKSSQTVKTPQGEMTQSETYSGYKEVAGVQFPYRIDVSGMRSMTMEVDTIEVNQGIDPERFQ
jgi:predicted Zn-dependent peptidase